MEEIREQMNIVIVGHVDHGKSTVIGRILADTGSLPQGKLEQVRRNCELNAKPFEYAFLLDALKDEQAQGITIDAARCFFKTKKRHYIIIDAPGHIEFLKNMITGAARAEAALLVIAANEGVQENSRRHGFMLSLLGIQQIVVLVNKMDLVGYDEKVFEKVKAEFQAFLDRVHLKPQAFVPISAREGDNLLEVSSNMPWYTGQPVLQLIDSFQKEKRKEDQFFRYPVQDIYKFTENGDDRRIFAGAVETGQISVGDEVIFLPSQKRTTIKSIEGFNEPERTRALAGFPAGFTVSNQVYVKPGEIMCRVQDTLPHVGTLFKANLFWLGKRPMVYGKRYKLKLATNRAPVYLKEIITVLDAASLSSVESPEQIGCHDVAECVLKTGRPIAFDCFRDIEATGRFVIVDDYEIVGGGIITEALASDETLFDNHAVKQGPLWEKSSIPPEVRAYFHGHHPKFIVVTGEEPGGVRLLARDLEKALFFAGINTYYLGFASFTEESGFARGSDREEQIRQLGEVGRLLNETGLVVIAAAPGLDDFELEILKQLNEPYEILVVVQGELRLITSEIILQIPAGKPNKESIGIIKQALKDKKVIFDYAI